MVVAKNNYFFNNSGLIYQLEDTELGVFLKHGVT